MVATERQNQAITEHEQSLVVTAGAGTGKTFVLVEKYLNLIQEKGLRASEILALTFTDKAAAEMRERVRSTVARRVEAEPDNPVWKQASEEIIIAPIMTFHAFCSQILREFAIEAGLEPGFVIIDEGQASAIRKEAFEILLRRAKNEVHEALVRLISQVERYRLMDLLSHISEHYPFYQEFFIQVRKEPERLIKVWEEMLTSLREPAVNECFSDPLITGAITKLITFARERRGSEDSAARYLSKVAPYLPDLNRESTPERLAAAARGFLSHRPVGRLGSQKIWDKESLNEFRDTKTELTNALERYLPYFELSIDPDSAFTEATFAFFQDLALITEEYMAEVSALKRQVSGLDFGDLITLTKRFLQESQDLVGTHLRPRFRYILVDEFQDTDPAQFDIITAILGDLTPDIRGLFIVGDPKQSIYLFRDADVTRFKEAQVKILSDCKGALINLDISFRSSPVVIGFVNYLFERIFASAKKPWEFGYEPLSVCKEREGTPGSVHILLPIKAHKDDPTTDSKENEARMVAEFIHQAVTNRELTITDRSGRERPATYGDFAILIERRTHLARYMQALVEKEAPFYVHGGIGFYARQEIYDIYNLLEFLVRPYDDAALYGLLRSPYFSLSDKTLFRIKCQIPGVTLFERLEASISYQNNISMEERKIKRAIDQLNRWLSYKDREPVVPLISKILTESGILTVYGAMDQGEQQVANLEKLIQIARGKAESGYGLSDLVDDMTASIGSEEREGEAALDTVSKTSVNIMTVHAAKGLEFPVVVLPDMGSAREGRLSPILNGDTPCFVGVKIPNPDHDYEIEETPIYRALSLIQREKEGAERKRLFYVGLTRARAHLILCGRRPDKIYTRIDASIFRIDWICTILGLNKDHLDNGRVVSLNLPEGIVGVQVITSFEQITRKFAAAQPKVLMPPSRYMGMIGRWRTW